MGRVPALHRPLRIRPAVVGSILLVVVPAAGCGGTAARGPSRPATTNVGSSTSLPPVPPSGTVRLTEAGDGRSVTVARGGTVQLVLHSTYWTVTPPPDAAVLRAEGAPVVVPEAGHCVVGQGCGTVTATWTALAPGTATVAAGRTVCGEAQACGPGQRTFRVEVTVG
ncbi:MAG TPA: hypothetical protein VND44_13275 [Acidimicrobiales bacterium]|nr:hypothetical protein [Acidimicrobiales bacterium]